jgi:hypothetical protein
MGLKLLPHLTQIACRPASSEPRAVTSFGRMNRWLEVPLLPSEVGSLPAKVEIGIADLSLPF